MEKRRVLVLGGAASGKSAFAESLACALSHEFDAPLVYVATLNAASGGDTSERIKKHRAARAGKGFSTLEWACASKPLVFSDGGSPKKPVALIEDFGNLVANYLYPLEDAALFQARADGGADAAVDALEALLQDIFRQTQACICVSNEISLGGALPEGASLYGEVLARLNMRAAALSSDVYAVVAGIPIALKSAFCGIVAHEFF